METKDLIRPSLFENYPNGQKVGDARHQLMKAIIGHCHQAIRQGYYLEAISFLDSLIEDRIESLLYELTQRKRNANTALGTLLKKFEEPDDNNIVAYNCIKECVGLYTLLKNEGAQYTTKQGVAIPNINQWSKDRNKVVHGFAKLPPLSIKDSTNFQEKKDKARQIALDGYELFKALDGEIKEYRKLKFITRERHLIGSRIKPVELVQGKGIRLKIRDKQHQLILDEYIPFYITNGWTKLNLSISNKGEICKEFE